VVPPRDFYYPDVHSICRQVPLFGVTCHIASTTLEECVPNAASTLTPIPVVPDLRLSDARAADYDVIYFCGGEGIEVFTAGGSSSAEARRLIQEALAAKCTVAAMGMGVVVLADAEVLNRRRAACYPYGKPPGVYQQRIKAHGAICSEEPIAEDGPFLTGRAPQDIQAFIRALLKRLGIEPRPPPSSSTAASP
jgi:putative intracellular protease/amidase